MTRRTITSLLVSDVEKRRFPEKHYVYVISVRWSDATNNIIYRRYSQFFNLQTDLIDKFPKESGRYNPEDRIMPFLPGKILFGRSNTRDVALKRQLPIDDYCQKLITLPARISECDDVIGFFEVNNEDIHPPISNERRQTAAAISDPLQVEHYTAIADYEKASPHEVGLTNGMAVDVIEKNETGWWLVSVDDEQGWVPSTYLERTDGEEDDINVQVTPRDEASYICTSDYQPCSDDEIGLDRGACVEVLRKKLDGWWWIRYRECEGWAPATYLKKLEPDRADHFPDAGPRAPTYPVQIVRNLFDVTTLALGNAGAQTERDERATTDKKTACETASAPVKPADNGPSKPTAVESVNLEPLNLNNANNEENGGDGIELRSGVDERPDRSRRSSTSSNSRFSSQPPRRNTIKRKVPPKRPEPPKVRKEFYTTADFTDHADDGLSFRAGQQVKVIERNTSGWWYVEIEQNLGWIPSSYVEEKVIQLVQAQTSKAPVDSCKGSVDAVKQSSTKPRKHSRETLGPPPEIPTVGVVEPEKPLAKPVKAVSAVTEIKTSETNDAVPKFSLFKSAGSSTDNESVGDISPSRKKSECTPPEIEAPRSKSHRLSVTDLASAIKNVLLRKSPPVTTNSPLPVESSTKVPTVDATVSPEKSTPTDYERYRVLADYERVDETEISLKENDLVLVIDKGDTGWWLVELDGKEGWAPETYLIHAGDDFYAEIKHEFVPVENEGLTAATGWGDAKVKVKLPITTQESVAMSPGDENYDVPDFSDHLPAYSSGDELTSFENGGRDHVDRGSVVARDAAPDGVYDEVWTESVVKHETSIATASSPDSVKRATVSVSSANVERDPPSVKDELKALIEARRKAPYIEPKSVEKDKPQTSAFSEKPSAVIETEINSADGVSARARMFGGTGTKNPGLLAKPVALDQQRSVNNTGSVSATSDVKPAWTSPLRVASPLQLNRPSTPPKPNVSDVKTTSTSPLRVASPHQFNRPSTPTKPNVSDVKTMSTSPLRVSSPHQFNRPSTPPKPNVIDVKTTSTAMHHLDRPSTSPKPKPNKAFLPSKIASCNSAGSDDVIKPKPMIALKSKPTTDIVGKADPAVKTNDSETKPKVNNLAAMFEAKEPTRARGLNKKAPMSEGTVGDISELNAVLSRRKAIVDT